MAEIGLTIKDKISNTWVGRLANNILSRIELETLNLYHDKRMMKLYRQIINEDKPFLLKPSELVLIHSWAEHQKEVEGDYAEVGVFKGTTAKAICEAKGDKNLHLFDTFEGLPDVGRIDTKFRANLYKSDLHRLKEKLAKYPNVFIYKGLFPKTTGPVANKKFAFVNLDVDIYQSTKDCLEFFYDRMSKGGVIISHDYHAQGVKKAFDDFFKNKKEKVIRLPMTQCMIIKK